MKRQLSALLSHLLASICLRSLVIHSPFHYIKGQSKAAVIVASKMNIKEAGTKRRATLRTPKGIKKNERLNRAVWSNQSDKFLHQSVLWKANDREGAYKEEHKKRMLLIIFLCFVVCFVMLSNLGKPKYCFVIKSNKFFFRMRFLKCRRSCFMLS